MDSSFGVYISEGTFSDVATHISNIAVTKIKSVCFAQFCCFYQHMDETLQNTFLYVHDISFTTAITCIRPNKNKYVFLG